MKTKMQLAVKPRKRLKQKSRHPQMKQRPQLCGAVFKVAKASPRKPCSALRAVCKIKVRVTKKLLWCFLPGDDQSQANKVATPHKVVLIQGGGPSDLPGVHYRLIRGWPSHATVSTKILEPPRRVSRRSKYGIKNRSRNKRIRLVAHQLRIKK